MADEDWNRLARIMGAVAQAPIRLAHIANSDLGELCGEAIRLAKIDELKILLIDGLHSLIHRRTADRIVETESTLLELKNLAETLKLPILVSAVADRPDRRHTDAVTRISDLNEAAAIERVADIVIILNRPDQDDRESLRAGEADLMVEKNRNGPLAVATVAFQAHYSRFANMARYEYPLFAPAQTEAEASPK